MSSVLRMSVNGSNSLCELNSLRWNSGWIGNGFGFVLLEGTLLAAISLRESREVSPISSCEFPTNNARLRKARLEIIGCNNDCQATHAADATIFHRSLFNHRELTVTKRQSPAVRSDRAVAIRNFRLQQIPKSAFAALSTRFALPLSLIERTSKESEIPGESSDSRNGTKEIKSNF